jgi:hypothetical protein
LRIYFLSEGDSGGKGGVVAVLLGCSEPETGRVAKCFKIKYKF